MTAPLKRFRIALSYPNGEYCAFIKQVADQLARKLGENKVFYDQYHRAELTRFNLDTHLQAIYHKHSELIAVFLCREYDKRDWCGLEWRALRDLIKRRRDDEIMPFRFDDTEVPGLFSIDGPFWIKDESPEDIAKLILERLGERRDPEFRPLRRFRMLAATAALLLLCTISAFWFLHLKPQHEEIDRHMDLARRYMNAGIYSAAGEEYEKILAIDHGRKDAQLGMEKAVLGSKFIQGDASQLQKFGRELDALLEVAPNDADLLILDGDRYYRRNEVPLAIQRYERALTLNPKLAEAHFRLGVLYDQAYEENNARSHYWRAVDLAPEIPHYMSNLAYLYLKNGGYDQAIEIYGRISKYPLAALESAKAHWAKGELRQAMENQKRAIGWLEDPKITGLPYNQGAWYFESANRPEGIRLNTVQDKRCYAGFALGASLFLKDDQAAAVQAHEQARCPENSFDLKDAVAADLMRYVEIRPELTEKSRMFRGRYLAE